MTYFQHKTFTVSISLMTVLDDLNINEDSMKALEMNKFKVQIE